jgi:HEPN domain-containing protein
MKELTKEWINKAENDYMEAKREISHKEPVYDAICFHSQQCVEKYLKAVLQENNIYFEKVHDLDVLLEKCKSIIPELLNFKEELIELSAFAVEIRYPGITSTREDAERSIAVAEKVRGIIRRYFGLDKK